MIDVRQTNELTPRELVTIFKERTRVFVVEQTCYYQEVDDEDYQCFHVRILDDRTNELMAYARIMPKKDSVTFGRVLVVEKFRRQGLGSQLLKAVLDYISTHFPGLDVEIEAQAYLTKFYGSFGFKQTSEIYLLDNIPHCQMKLAASVD
ncbi:ElaA protein [Limosilactobacillus mucosae]|uniref:GCN5 family acetyltransferase n=3 Tax=Limosilactobacillus mucosae TaxID=97478 RepID=A0A0D4CI79_LIMMU|nr:GNAT family N-acetyltransferase [Limosilactobacillus mucosae]MDO5012972.1 GNAT family N-acetyltransferase [Lactobacillaceae bacterium]AJT49838.1 GCN5 family acetyltransferase [Limosilactobacillus mucosae LM1]KRL26781.1 acetyltransferase [Limosilactobacillus mucosae DSM 13345]MBN2900241.1 GNAT family N-acetyltransferase [Limosilactobacillus mucosae]MCF0119161.1 GNAT family N-acetyltransferase [Limosilactobacillus mucosae]